MSTKMTKFKKRGKMPRFFSDKFLCKNRKSRFSGVQNGHFKNTALDIRFLKNRLSNRIFRKPFLCKFSKFAITFLTNLQKNVDFYLRICWQFLSFFKKMQKNLQKTVDLHIL